MSALEDVRVLDLTHMIAGPYCTRLYALYGAEVIKIERPGEGDAMRRHNPVTGTTDNLEAGCAFLYLNTGKKGITLNLKSAAGKKVFTQLVQESDVLVENCRPGVMPALGFGYEAVAALNRKLIMVSISNFGQTGPYRDYKATELNLQAWSGLMHLTGESEREPLRLGYSTAQYEAGQNAFAASLVALLARPTLGGQHVDIAIMDTVMSGLHSAQAHYSYNQEIPRRRRSLGPDIHKAKDGYVMARLSYAASDIERLSKIVGEPLSVDNRQHTTDAFRRWVASHSKEEVMEAGQSVQFAWGALNNTSEISNARHLNERNFLQSLTHPVAGTLPYVGAPFRMSASEAVLSPAPTLGQYNHEIFCDRLAYSSTQLEAWQQDGVI